MHNHDIARQDDSDAPNIITARRPGPITLDLNLLAGIVMIGVGPVDRAQVELRTPDTSGPAYDLVNNPRVSDRGDVLSIDARVPGNGAGPIQIGRMVVINGVVVSGGGVSLHGSGTIEARAVLPIGSALIAETAAADVLVRGHLNGARVKTMSGDVELETVTNPDVETMSGDIRIDVLASDGRAKSMSGDIRVASGGVWTLHASTMSGDIEAPRPIRIIGSSMSGRVRNH